MNIFHVITTIERAGAENHLVSLVKGQVGKGHSVTVAFLKGKGYWKNHFENTGVSVVPLRMKYYGDFAALTRLIRAIRKSKPDVVHAHLQPAEVYTYLAIRLAGCSAPFIITKHNVQPLYRGFLQRALCRWVGQRASLIIAISEAVKKCYHEEGLSHCPIITSHYGIDTGPFEKVDSSKRQEYRKKWGIDDTALLFGTVARLTPEKSLDTMLEGFKMFNEAENIEAKLCIIGGGRLEGELRRYAGELGISERVIWGGFQEDVPSILRAFDVFILTSIFEGFGLVLLEAMASRLPVIATRVTAIPEIVADGITGVLIPSKDPNAVAMAMGKMLDQRIRGEMGAKGYARVRELFTEEKMVEFRMAIYEIALSRKKMK